MKFIMFALLVSCSTVSAVKITKVTCTKTADPVVVEITEPKEVSAFSGITSIFGYILKTLLE